MSSRKALLRATTLLALALAPAPDAGRAAHTTPGEKCAVAKLKAALTTLPPCGNAEAPACNGTCPMEMEGEHCAFITTTGVCVCGFG